MSWIQVLALVISVLGCNIFLLLSLWLWSRSEASSDRREITAILHEMKNEMKDFHSKLLVLEDRYLRIREKEITDP